MSYVTCKNCGFNIQLPYECRFEYPLHFSATCPLCKHTDLYHRLEVIQEDDEYCRRELEKVEKTTKQLEDAVTQSFLLNAIYSPMQILIETLSTLKQKLGYRGKAGEERGRG
jgi:predicted nucleic-acid-binding Zn-ribbon protein